jgi:hypothetical protein
MLSAIAGGYSNFSQDQQFDITHLVRQLQELMTVGKVQCSIISDHNAAFIVGAPNAPALFSQCKLHAKPMHEIQANKSTKKIKKSIQNMGLLQDVHHNCVIQAEHCIAVSVPSVTWLRTALGTMN